MSRHPKPQFSRSLGHEPQLSGKSTLHHRYHVFLFARSSRDDPVAMTLNVLWVRYLPLLRLVSPRFLTVAPPGIATDVVHTIHKHTLRDH